MAASKMVLLLRASIAMAMFCAIAFPSCARAQSLSPAPAPANDDLIVLSFWIPAIVKCFWIPATVKMRKFRTSVDQGIAYLLMLVALVLTYLIHPLDASSIF